MKQLFANNNAQHAIVFFTHWLRKPVRAGAIAPSGRALSTAMAQEIDPTKSGIVIELGGGTGSITQACLNAGLAPQNLVVFEREPSLCKLVSTRFPGVRVVCGDARDLSSYVQQCDLGPVQSVLSSLPLLAMSAESRQQILRQAFEVMTCDGAFVQYTYGPRSPISRDIYLDMNLFARRKAWILKNAPPASVWRYTRTRPLI